MLTIIGDTHRESGHGLTDEARRAVSDADQVCHTGDFTTEAVYEAIVAEAGPDTPVTAVHGNSDTAALRERLPETATVEFEGLRLVLAHGHRHDRTSLGLLARQEGADVAVVGHTHTPGIETVGDLVVLNPGSYTDPRGSPQAFGRVNGSGQISIRTPAGSRLVERSLGRGR